jgi:hypothetical protein
VVQAEVKSQLCPTFFQLGRHRAADEACTLASLRVVSTSRMVTALHYPSDRAACDAATLGGRLRLPGHALTPRRARAWSNATVIV